VLIFDHKRAETTVVSVSVTAVNCAQS